MFVFVGHSDGTLSKKPCSHVDTLKTKKFNLIMVYRQKFMPALTE